MTQYNFTIVIQQDGDQGWHVYVPELPGCHSFGRSPEEARMMIEDAITLYMEELASERKVVKPTPTIVDNYTCLLPA